MNLISVIVTTYNWPEVLEACLESLIVQTDKNFEIIIADDGSEDETRALIHRFVEQTEFAVKHVYHEDRGFRAGTIRNKAVAKSKGDYLIFLDGDCVVCSDFVERHRLLAEPGFFVPGNRVLLTAAFTAQVLRTHISLHQRSIWYFLWLRIKGHVNRVLPFIYIPTSFFRYQSPYKWQKAMTCNLAMSKNDFVQVNGFDESFEGWGYEDSDLVVRLIHSGIRRKEGRFAVPVIHYWHSQSDQSQHDENYQRLKKRLEDTDCTRIEEGVEQYL